MKAERRATVAVMGFAALLALTVGWQVFWFLCDDAFIAFRYVSNAQLGHGYVWNAPPFRPVEGYTSFLWVVILDLVWRFTGTEPPDAANAISLGLSWVSLGLVMALFRRLTLPESLEPARVPLLGLVLLGTVSNRTFLAWTSSGLETALWTCTLLAWTYVALGLRGRPAWLVSLLAALMCLTRPDGLLFAAATAAWIVWRAGVRREPARLLHLAPLGLVVAHVAWRYSFYGYLLPNTWYAKHIAAWPQMGWRYAAHFAIEYAYWVWAIAAVVAGVRWVAALKPPRIDAVLMGVVTLAAHWAYYTLRVGGDHFEFRIYHHLVPLLMVSFPFLAARAGLAARGTIGAMVFMIALGSVIPWTHWRHTHMVMGHKDPGSFKYPVARHLPAPLSWYANPWDSLHETLLSRFIAIRQQGHRTYLNYQRSRFPTREQGLSLDAGDDIAVYTHTSVGWPAWAMPEVALIDMYGLSDLVIARSEPRTTDPYKRRMAHDRKPPPGYPACLRPNVKVSGSGEVTVNPRARPLTAADVIACESQFLGER